MPEKLTINGMTVKTGISVELNTENVGLFFGEDAAKKMKKILSEKRDEHSKSCKIVDIDYDTKVVTFEAVK